MIYLVNGIRLQGEIESHDQYGLMLRGSSQQFVYKHAISTVVPIRDVEAVTQPNERGAGADAVTREVLRRRTRPAR